jgi:hypothetical protein
VPAIAEVMDLKRTHLHTDGGAAYKSIAPHAAAHEFVDHTPGEYTRGNISTNLAEGYFSQLKRSIDGTHHHVSTEHLDRYLAQFDFHVLPLPRHRHSADAPSTRTGRRTTTQLQTTRRLTMGCCRP